MYFDADSLVTAQLEMMEDWKVKIKKVAYLEENTDTVSYIADSARLYQELNVFRKANINKPAFDDRYDRSVDTEGGVKQVTYLPADEEDELEVKSLTLWYENNNLQQLEAVVSEDHWLYDSRRKLSLSFDMINSVPYISSYSLQGTQKMIFRDRVNFNVEGDILPQSTASLE